MNVVVCLEHHFARTPDGRFWTQVAFAYRFWQRYLGVFDEVRVVARVKDVPSEPSNHVRADGPGVTMHAVPDYLGPWQYLCNARAVRQAVANAIGPRDAIILRVASQLANGLFPLLRRQGRPYAVEVVGDPWDVFSPGASRHILRPLFRRYFAWQQRVQCAHACAAAYVTEHALQRRYPIEAAGPSESRYAVDGSAWRRKPLSIAISSVELSQGSFACRQRGPVDDQATIGLVMVGSLAQPYKGCDTAITAVAACLGSGLDVRLTIIGDGKYRQELKRQAAVVGVTDRIVFRGQLPQGAAVREELDRNDLFLMPSRTEGLPRALLEAMARGLPCIGSNVGGIPELLPPEDLFPPGDAEALTAKIREVVTNRMRMQEMSARNLRRAMDFREEVLAERRCAFLTFVRERTSQWWRTQYVDTSPAPAENCARRGLGLRANARVGAAGS